MRLDKFLKVSRVIKRRTVANEACDNGRVCVNGRVAKAGTAVNPGDIVQVEFAGGSTRFEVLSVEENVKKSGAAEMYRILTSLALVFFLCLNMLTGCVSAPEPTESAAPLLPAGESCVMVVNRLQIFDEQFCYLFTAAADALSDGETSDEWLAAHFQEVMDRTVQICRERSASYEAGRAAGMAPTPADYDEISASINDLILRNQNLLDREDLQDGDQVCLYLTGMNYREYKRFVTSLWPGEKYSEKFLADYQPTDEEQKTFYEQNKDRFRTYAAEMIYLPENDEQGRSNENTAGLLLDMIRSRTYPFPILARGWSAAPDVLSNSGSVELCAADDSLAKPLRKWASKGGASAGETEPELIREQGEGFYILQDSRQMEYEESSKLRETVLAVMKQEKLAAHKAELAAEEKYTPKDYDPVRAALVVKTFLEGRKK